VFKKGPIPPLVHGFLDYALGIFLVAAPFIFSFEADAATALGIVAGVVVLVLAASTAWNTGLIKSVPVVVHAMLDYVLAAVLIAAPFLFVFSDDDGTATAFFIAYGVATLLYAIATRYAEDVPRGRRPVSSAPRSP
jgi:SPW repeat-containing protein